MKVDVTWREAVHFESVADSGHEVLLDGPPDLGGTNAGTRPMELMLMAIAGCAATDVVHILGRGRVSVESCTVQAKAERADEEPRVFTSVHLHFCVAADGLTEHKLARAVSLSAEKYCSGSILMQRAGVCVTHSHEVISP